MVELDHTEDYDVCWHLCNLAKVESSTNVPNVFPSSFVEHHILSGLQHK